MIDYRQYIEIDPEVRFGQPCFIGTRMTVSDLLSYLSSDMTEEEILEDCPRLSKNHIKAALAFAAERDGILRLAS